MLGNGLYFGKYILDHFKKDQNPQLRFFHSFIKNIEENNTKQPIIWLFSSNAFYISPKRDFVCERWNGFDYMAQKENFPPINGERRFFTLAGFHGMPANPKIPMRNNRYFETPDGLKELICKSHYGDSFSFVYLKNIYKAVIEPDIGIYSEED